MCILLVRNPCYQNQGNCSHFCLISSTTSTGYRCACPDGMMLINDTDCGRTYFRVIILWNPKAGFLGGPMCIYIICKRERGGGRGEGGRREGGREAERGEGGRERGREGEGERGG